MHQFQATVTYRVVAKDEAEARMKVVRFQSDYGFRKHQIEQRNRLQPTEIRELDFVCKQHVRRVD